MLWPVRWHATIDEGQHATISMTDVANWQKKKLQAMGQNAARLNRTSLNFSRLSFSKPIYIITSMLWTTIWVNLALLALARNVNYKKQMCTKSNSWKKLLYGIFPVRCLRLVVKALLFKMKVQWNWYLRPHVKAFLPFFSFPPHPSLLYLLVYKYLRFLYWNQTYTSVVRIKTSVNSLFVILYVILLISAVPCL